MDTTRKALEGRIIVVSGASSGVGYSAARRLALHEGATVVAVARRRVFRIEALAKQIAEQFHAERLLPITADMAAPGQAEALAQQVEEKFGRIDGFLHGVNRALRLTALEVSDQEFDLTMQVNVKSALYGVQAIAPSLRAPAARRRDHLQPDARPDPGLRRLGGGLRGGCPCPVRAVRRLAPAARPPRRPRPRDRPRPRERGQPWPKSPPTMSWSWRHCARRWRPCRQGIEPRRDLPREPFLGRHAPAPHRAVPARGPVIDSVFQPLAVPDHQIRGRATTRGCPYQ